MFTYDGIVNALDVGELDQYLAANDLDLGQLAAKDFPLANLIGQVAVAQAHARRDDISEHQRNQYRDEAEKALAKIQAYINTKN